MVLLLCVITSYSIHYTKLYDEAIEDFETENDVTVESVTAGVYMRIDNDVERIIDIKIDI